MYQEQRFYKIHRTLVAQNQLNETTVVAKVQLNVIDSYVIIAQALKDPRLQLEDKIIRIYDFQRQVYNIVHPQTKIPVSWISGSGCDLILVKLGTIMQSVTSLSGSASQEGERLSQTSSVKKERSKQRVIFEVIQIVKKWRELHQSKNSLKKMSLLEAAKMLRMPKKSLDDYYYQLRLGQKFGFDFEKHLFDRVGVLRSYLKNLKGHSNIDKYEKHPKSLKIIQRFDQISELYYSRKNGYRNTAFQMQEQMGDQDVKAEEGEDDQINSSGMNNFKSDFEYLLDEKDPFLMGNYNFKKKMMDDLEQDQIFF